MCDFKSAIVLKDRVYVPDHDSHSDMLEELGIKDTFDKASELFVRVELSPTDGNKASDVEGWKLKVDQDITPDWWLEKIDLPRLKEAVKKWQAKHVFTEGRHEVKDGIYYALGTSTVKAWGNATVEAGGNATVKAWDNATVEAGGNATVEAGGNATVKAWDNATVKAGDNATVKAWGNATVKAWGNATVEAGDNATVVLPSNWWGNPKVTVFDEAVYINRKNNTITTKGNFTLTKIE